VVRAGVLVVRLRKFSSIIQMSPNSRSAENAIEGESQRECERTVPAAVMMER
jgi:hypothetical protein